MWRLGYALHGLPAGDTFRAPFPTAVSSSRLYCDRASLIVELDKDGSQNCDACLLSASTVPGGKIISLHINGDRAEMREAYPLSGMCSPSSPNEERTQLRIINNSIPLSDTHHSDEMNLALEETGCLLPLHTTPWRKVSSTLVLSENNDNEPLQRLRHYGEFEPVVSLLAVDAVYKLHLEPLERTDSFKFDRTAVNATALDCWGPHAILVGFSSGEVCVVDWRDPSGGPLIRTSVAQPYIDCQRPRGRRAGAALPLAGVMSCCALEDCFRVVCGLADHCGTVVVTDLRKAVTRSSEARKRGRISSAEEAKQAVVAGSFSTPTSYPVCDIKHCRTDFSTIGMVDTGGTGVLTTFDVLESGLLNKRRARSVASWGASLNASTSTTYATQHDTNSDIGGSGSGEQKIITHTRSLRCDVSRDGRFLVNTGTAPWSAALTARNRKPAELLLSLETNRKIDGERFTSVSTMGTVICAQTAQGNALCATFRQ